MLAPFLILLSLYVARTQSDTACREKIKTKITIPWFAVMFIAVIGINSLFKFPQSLVSDAVTIDTLLLSTAMAALGLCTHYSSIKKAGYKPLLLAGILFLWLILGGWLINRMVMS